jgi:hypothetical protein
MGVSRQSVQRLANELDEEGIVRFAPNPHHQRAKLIVLTARGRALYDAAMSRQRPWARSLADGVDAQEVGTAVAVLRLLRSRLESAADTEETRAAGGLERSEVRNTSRSAQRVRRSRRTEEPSSGR